MLPATPIITIGAPLIELSTVDSTNIYAMEQIRLGQAISGSAYFTQEQTQGRGQMGKFWESEKGQNILISYVLDWEKAAISPNFGLSVAVSLGVYDFFSAIAGEETSLKWPNDLYWRDRKAVGILIQNSLKGKHISWSVIGIGINVNQTVFSEAVPKGVSLKQITGKTFDLRVLIKDLSYQLSQRLNDWTAGKAAAQLEEYNQLLFRKNKLQAFMTEQGAMEGVIKEVNQEGQLILDTGKEEAFNFGTLQWKI